MNTTNSSIEHSSRMMMMSSSSPSSPNDDASPPGSPMKSPPTLSTTSIEEKDQDVAAFVSDMLSEMELDFQQTGNSIRDKMSKIGQKMDLLERSISDLMTDAGLDGNGNGNGDRVSVDDTTASMSTPDKNRTNKDTV